MEFKIKISKKLLFKVALFAAFIGAALILDNYFENNPVNFYQVENNSSQAQVEHGTIYLFAQVNSLGAKTPAQKTPDRKLIRKSHDKLLQKYHQIRDYQVIKGDSLIPKTPKFLTCNYLIFRKCLYPVPDDEPLIS